MHLLNQLAILAIITTTQAFHIPEGTKDGVYMVRSNENGVEEHISVARTPIVEAVSEDLAARSLEKRAGPIYCGCGIHMVPGDCDNAVAALKSQFRGGTVTIAGGRSLYSIRGRVVAFVCNNVSGNNALTTNAQALTGSLGDITNACGRYIPGANLRSGSSSGNGLVHGYQEYISGVDFCGGWANGKYGGC